MKPNNWQLRIYIIFLLIFSLYSPSFSQQQSEKSENISSYSTGLTFGWYNPSMDYWKTASEFKDAGFNGAMEVNAFFDLTILRDLQGKIGLGYWQESVKDSLQSFGITTFLLTGIPLNIDFLYKITPLKFSIVTPYLGVGGEYLFVQHKMKFDLNNDPAPETGSTVLGHIIAGFETKLSENFAVDLEFQYKFGSYKQDFKIQDPANPDTNEIITETISLNGSKIGISLKYYL